MATAVEIPQNVKDLINSVIINDEGGWVITSNPNDPDGGWTFGGLTSKNWMQYLIDNKIGYTAAMLPNIIAQDIGDTNAISMKQIWIDRGIKIYYEKFYQPLVAIIQKYGILADIAHECEFSCYIQCPTVFESLLNIARSHNLALASDNISESYKKCFCKAWMDHYIQLVKSNAEAWRDYGDYMYRAHYLGITNAPIKDKPATLRAEFLQGWFNRVWRYLP